MKLMRVPTRTSVSPVRSSRSETTQIRIQEAASELFRRRGYNATSVDDIAEAANVVKGTFYYHFSGKDAIYAILCLKAADASSKFVAALQHESLPGIQKLFRLIQYLVRQQLDPDVQHVFFEEYVPLSQQSRTEVRGAQKQYAQALAQAIREAQHDGSVHAGNPGLMGMAMYGAIGRVAVWYNSDGQVGREEAEGTLTGMFLRSVATGKGMVDGG